MGDPNPVIRVCKNGHPLITYTDKRDDPQPCPICGRVQQTTPMENR